MDSVKKYYQMVEDGVIAEKPKQKKYRFGCEELKNFVHLVKLNPQTPTDVLVDMLIKSKK